MSPELSDANLEVYRYRFDEFVVDVPDRQLWRGDVRLELNARYLDALVLLIRERNLLVEKDRFFDDVWTDVVVSDSALTQCIKEIRKQLGDDASNPRYIQTVPGHGYRFIGDTEPFESDGTGSEARASSTVGADPQVIPQAKFNSAWYNGLHEWGAGTLGGWFAGLLGGVFYGFGLASADGGVGTLSTLFVLIAFSSLVGLMGGVGVSFGFAGAGVVARYFPNMRMLLHIVGAAFGGLVIGATAKLLGVDSFNLFFGRAPAGITGGPEGAVLGAALALGAHVGHRFRRRDGAATRLHAVAGAGFVCAIAGALIPLTGGRLMGGSLDLLALSFTESRLELDRIGSLFGELNFGRSTEVALSGLEGFLFGACVVGALALLDRSRRTRSSLWQS